MKCWMMVFPLLPLLGGCLQDTASYTLGDREHAITLVRNQTWPWQSTLNMEVMVLRKPDCNGGGTIPQVERDASLGLYRAPDEYPEPLFLLKVDQRVYALSTLSCRLQPFEKAPDELGQKLGQFVEKDGKFQFVEAGAAGQGEE
jgi:hypothetical protein